MKILRDEKNMERIVMAEVLTPETLNTYGDFYTRDSIKQFCYSFAESGYGLDINHNNVDLTGKLLVVESFIAREGDPTFIEGSWVVGILIRDDEIWADVISGEINGLSYEAIARFVDIIIDIDIPSNASGVTEPDIYDGHTHKYTVILTSEGRIVSGGTDITNGHDHEILLHTSTELTLSHRHIFNLTSAEEE